MLLNITDNRSVADLQDKFNECFPNLQIEFYNERHGWQQESAESFKISPQNSIGEIRHNHNSGSFEIKSWYKTGRVEQEFRDIFGLHVQIFFRKGNQWVQSLSADDLTLAHLNELSGSIL
jgi:hypothetical protein